MSLRQRFMWRQFQYEGDFVNILSSISGEVVKWELVRDKSTGCWNLFIEYKLIGK